MDTMKQMSDSIARIVAGNYPVANLERLSPYTIFEIVPDLFEYMKKFDGYVSLVATSLLWTAASSQKYFPQLLDANLCGQIIVHIGEGELYAFQQRLLRVWLEQIPISRKNEIECRVKFRSLNEDRKIRLLRGDAQTCEILHAKYFLDQQGSLIIFVVAD